MLSIFVKYSDLWPTSLSLATTDRSYVNLTNPHLKVRYTRVLSDQAGVLTFNNNVEIHDSCWKAFMNAP